MQRMRRQMEAAAADEEEGNYPDRATFMRSQRESLIKRMAVVIILDCCILAGIISIIIPNAAKTETCAPNLYNAGTGICVYHTFFVLRNMIICAVSYFTKNPIRDSTMGRISCVCFDCCIYSAIVVWATVSLFDEQSTDCRDTFEEV